MSNESRQRLDEYTSEASDADVRRIRGELDGMNRGPVGKVWNDVRSLWALVCDPAANWGSKAMAIGALIYLISPLDAVPDLIPIAGLADDVGVILAAVSSLCFELKKYKDKIGL